jgi:hypothetical protein
LGRVRSTDLGNFEKEIAMNDKRLNDKETLRSIVKEMADSMTGAVITHPVWAGRGPAAWVAGSARASRMAVRALRLLRRPVSTIEQRAA